MTARSSRQRQGEVTVEAAVEREPLYHYTDAAGLLGILSKQTIWATGVEYLNDAEEVLYARDQLRSALADRLEKLPAPLRPSSSNTDERRAHRLRQIIQHLDRLDYGFGLYVACFSEVRDSLSQWRAYGGYAVGFRRVALHDLAADLEKAGNRASHSPNVVCQLRRVRYGVDGRVRAEFAQEAAELDDAGGGVGPALRGIAQLRKDGLPLLATVKQPSFADESEWRLLASGPYLQPQVAFRVGGLGLIPFAALGFQRDAIQEIVVGPSAEPGLRKQAVRHCLALNAFSHAVVVSGSDSTLRT